MSFYYYQNVGGHEEWKPIPESQIHTIQGVMFTTILTVNTPVRDDFSKEEFAAIKYSGPLYFDLDDAASPASTAVKAVELLEKLKAEGLPPSACRIYASGGKGFHITVDPACFMEKPERNGTAFLPYIYKEMAFKYAVDSLDLRVYTARKGRMFRRANVIRPNNLYKVPISFEELKTLADMSKQEAEAKYVDICSKPRNALSVEVLEPVLAPGLTVAYAECKDKVTKFSKTVKKSKLINLPSQLPSFEALLRGEGIKEGTGFHPIAMQIAIIAHAKGMGLEDLVTAAEGLCSSHKSDGDRYNTPAKRKAEITRMWHYTHENPCYLYSPRAVVALLNHSAPDLQGMEVTEEEVKAGITNPEEGVVIAEDEYEHAGVTLTSRGAYTLTEMGPKKLTAVGFENVTELVSTSNNTISTVQADVFVAGKHVGNKVMDLETFNSVSNINKMSMPYGQSFNGNDSHARGVFMRLVEKARRTRSRMYSIHREGLDMVSIPFHEDEELRKEFMVWSDFSSVTPEPRIADTGLKLKFVGFPTETGQFQTDLSKAPSLPQWIKDPDNKETLRKTLDDLLACQAPEHVGKLLGWMIAANYRMLFHKNYSKFPLLHINGAAGQGKCLGKGTPVILADGTTVAVEQVKVGDRLVSPYGGYNTVTSLARGRETLYRVNQNKADSYVVNASHLLSLKSLSGSHLVIEVSNFIKKDHSKEFFGWKPETVTFEDGSVKKIKSELSTLSFEDLGEGDYYGFTLDGDRHFLLGDFTVTHNTEMTRLMSQFHYYRSEPKVLTPTSTLFAVAYAAAGSASVPLILDEFKPQEMNPNVYDRFKLMLRDAYNCRNVERGGGNKESTDYRAVHTTQLSAPICFIAEAAESESALMERVVMLTLVKPPVVQAQKYLQHFMSAVRNKEVLGIVGSYIAASIVKSYSLERLDKEFSVIYKESRMKLMLQESDDISKMTQQELAAKSGAKERTVFNYSVVKFGLKRLQALLSMIFPGEYEARFQAMLDVVDSTVVSLQEQTVPEWLKVMNTFADLAAVNNSEALHKLIENQDYAYITYNGKMCIELYLRSCYFKYRAYVAISRMKPLFPNEAAFIHAMNNIPALEARSTSEALSCPGGSHIYSLDELRASGFMSPGVS